MAHRIAAFTERDSDGVPASLGKKMIKKEEGKDGRDLFVIPFKFYFYSTWLCYDVIVISHFKPDFFVEFYRQ